MPHAPGGIGREGSGKAKTRIFVVDDHPVVRDGLSHLIHKEADLMVSGEAATAQEALLAIETSLPDLMIVAISLAEGPDGIELVKTIRKIHPNLPILVFSRLEERLYAERALRAGANGYLMKIEKSDQILVAIRQVLAQQVYLSDRMRKEMLQQMAARPGGPAPTGIEILTDREQEIFRLIGNGERISEIAKELQLSVKTVEAHFANIRKKLSLKNGRELVHQAIQWKMSGERKARGE